jgi:DNA-directed RNA polymerase alpha subunit
MFQMFDPTEELADDTALNRIRFPSRIRNVFAAEGLTTVGEVREASDATLLTLQNFGRGSVAYLRQTLGLPSRATAAHREVEAGSSETDCSGSQVVPLPRPSALPTNAD